MSASEKLRFPATTEEEERGGGPLSGLYARGRRAWPELDLCSSVFERFVERQHSETSKAENLASLCAEDLFLACACAQGDPQALTAFKDLFQPEIHGIATRMGCAPSLAHEIEQKIWIRLFVGQPPRSPRIAEYSGRGSLRSWTRTLSTRAVIDELRTARDLHLDTAMCDALLAPDPDPETEYLKRLYSAEFRAAFSEAFASLPVRQRNLLSQYFLDGLTVTQLGALYELHPATAARQIHAAKALLLERTRALLSERLKIEDQSLDSIFRLIASRLEFLAESPEAEEI